MRVHCYWNLHKGGYSIRAAEGTDKGRVIRHTAAVFLIDCVFVVHESARQRVLRDRRKSVHAFVKGFVADRFGTASTQDAFDASELVRVVYDPYKGPDFVRLDTLQPVHAAEWVWLTTVDERAAVWVD